MIDLIIFDCDGVLVDSEPIANQTLADHASAFGVPMTMEDSMRHFVGLSMKSVMEKLGQMASRPVPENFLDRLQADTFARFEHQLKPVSGIMAALDAIEAMGLATCVASSGGHDKLAVTLGLTGLRPRFEGRIYSATEVKSGKPAPDLFLYAAQQMGSLPERAIVIEDSCPGVIAARAAGMTALGYAPHGNGAELAALGARPFQTMQDLPHILARLCAES
jgi:HAD superfamily hydrolase (TIGR01509 family)